MNAKEVAPYCEIALCSEAACAQLRLSRYSQLSKVINQHRVYGRWGRTQSHRPSVCVPYDIFLSLELNSGSHYRTVFVFCTFRAVEMMKPALLLRLSSGYGKGYVYVGGRCS